MREDWRIWCAQDSSSPCTLKSLSAHARPLADHCAQEAGRSAGDLGKSNSCPCGRARGQTAPCPHCRLEQVSQSERRGCGSLRRHAAIDCDTEYRDGGGRRDRRRHATHGEGPGGLPPVDDLLWRRPTDRARLCRRNRRSVAHPPLARHRRLSGVGSKTPSVRRGRLRRRRLEVRAPAGADASVRDRQRRADPLHGQLKLKERDRTEFVLA